MQQSVNGIFSTLILHIHPLPCKLCHASENRRLPLFSLRFHQSFVHPYNVDASCKKICFQVEPMVERHNIQCSAIVILFLRQVLKIISGVLYNPPLKRRRPCRKLHTISQFPQLFIIEQPFVSLLSSNPSIKLFTKTFVVIISHSQRLDI